MFCDLVGSTALAARLDAEDWRNLVNAYLDEATSAVTALGGHVLKRLGDGLMALFGYPQAQENDAERAVRAALAIQRALAELNARNAGRNAPELSAEIRRFDKVNAYLYGWGLAARKGPRSKGRPEGRPSLGRAMERASRRYRSPDRSCLQRGRVHYPPGACPTLQSSGVPLLRSPMASGA